MRKINPPRKITIQVDGIFYDAKYIGRGQYSKVYRIGDRVVYYTRGDCAKEVLAMYQYERMTHLPELVRHENITMPNRVVWYVFSSPYYKNITAKDTSAYIMTRILIAEHIKFMNEYRGYQYQAYGRVHEDERAMEEFIKYLRQRKTLPQSILKALYNIYELGRNCGNEIGFDFKRSNFGVNEYGTLIFRDPIWVWG